MAQVSREQQEGDQCSGNRAGQLHTRGCLHPFFFVFAPLDFLSPFLLVSLSAPFLAPQLSSWFTVLDPLEQDTVTRVFVCQGETGPCLYFNGGV